MRLRTHPLMLRTHPLRLRTPSCEFLILRTSGCEIWAIFFSSEPFFQNAKCPGSIFFSSEPFFKNPKCPDSSFFEQRALFSKSKNVPVFISITWRNIRNVQDVLVFYFQKIQNILTHRLQTCIILGT